MSFFRLYNPFSASYTSASKRAILRAQWSKELNVIMKKLTFAVMLLLFLGGCGEKTLVIRSALEGDSYLRNNASELSEQQFQSLLVQQAAIEEDAYTKLQTLLSEHEHTRYMLAENRIYRYDTEGELLYVADWTETEDSGVFKIAALTFP
ncbi:hypothetical protein ABC3169 [Shouchella clausii KSM-K16]|uniref:Uncharacterized protein n=2 Tax=Bacillaceae TaxID=186817 RepID=Q5WD57_SHOC1|nr:hypothetical protein ABC3169 [Shouchella clausii KSM-K16]